MGVFVRATSEQNAIVLREFIRRHRRSLQAELPQETRIDGKADWPIVLSNDQEMPDRDRQRWLKENLNTFVNVLRPKLAAFYAAHH